jgi:LysR family transcriptional regulator, nitrogen assimilation regulatory protein
MDVRSLRYFHAVVEFGSYSRAAKFLRISQPAVSRQVSLLEKELGKILLVRSGHGATPTHAGRLLFERSQTILRQLESAASEIRSIQSEPAGSLSLAVPPGAGHFLLPPLVQRFRSLYPNVLLKVVAGFSGFIHEALVRGRVDVACLHGPSAQKGFEIVPLIEEEVFLVGKRGLLPPGRRQLRTEELKNYPLILPSRSHSSRRLLDELSADRGIGINMCLEVDDPSLIRSLLREGLGFSLLSQGAFRNEVEHDVLDAVALKPRMFWPLAMMRSTAHPRTELVEALVSSIREVVREGVQDGSWPGRLRDRQVIHSGKRLKPPALAEWR